MIRSIVAADRRATRQMLWMAAILGVQFVASIVQLSLSARILGPDGYGILAVIIAVTSLLYGFMSMPGSQAIVTFVARSVAKGAADEAACIIRFTAAAALALALFSFVLLGSIAIAANGALGIGDDHVTALLTYGATGLFLATLQESLAVLRLADRLFLGFVITTLGSLVRVAILLSVWSLDGDLMGIVLAYLVAAFVNGTGMSVAATISARKAGVDGLLTSFSLRVPYDVVRFQLISFCQTKVGALAGNLDVLLLGPLVSPGQLGLYRAARQIVDATRLPARPIAEAIQVEYSRQWYAQDGASLRRSFRRFTALSAAVAATLYLALLGFHRIVIRLLLGDEFVESESILTVMVPGAFSFMGASGLYFLPAAVGRAMPSLVSTLFALAAMVAGVILLVPSYGIAGAAWSRTIYFLVLVCLMCFFAFRTVRDSYGLQPASENDALGKNGKSGHVEPL